MGSEDQHRGDKRYFGVPVAKIWNYLIAGVAVLIFFVIINFVMTDPEKARHSIQKFLNLPSFAYPSILAAVGLVIWWIGIKIEPDWPEAVGAGLIAIAVGLAEIMIGWRKFALGGLSIIPIVLPILVFLVFLGLGARKSK
jgi:hypothetical protein